jgi:peptidyl-tRNA hydrolase, PTH2 family
LTSDAPRGSSANTEPVEYYLAVPGLPGTELALLAARGALLAHRRFRARPGYQRWYAGAMAKVVLRAEAEEITTLARAYDGLTIPEAPDLPLLAVFRPRPKRQALFLSHLKLYSGRVAPSTRAEWPQDNRHVPLFLNASLDLSAGKLAAQAAHAALVLRAANSRRPGWAEWLAAGLPLALARVPAPLLEQMVEEGRAWGVTDEGRTEVTAGSLTIAAAPPGSLGEWQTEPDVALLALAVGRPLVEK